MIMKKLKVYTFFPLVSFMLIPLMMIVFIDIDSETMLAFVAYTIAISLFFKFDRDGRFLFRNYIESLYIIRGWILRLFQRG